MLNQQPPLMTVSTVLLLSRLLQSLKVWQTCTVSANMPHADVHRVNSAAQQCHPQRHAMQQYCRTKPGSRLQVQIEAQAAPRLSLCGTVCKCQLKPEHAVTQSRDRAPCAVGYSAWHLQQPRPSAVGSVSMQQVVCHTSDPDVPATASGPSH